MTECSKCGACCDPVVLMFTPDDMVGPSGPFAWEHWRVVGERPTPHDASGRTEYLIECDQFDKDMRLCTAHGSRPPICSGYPWYGAEPKTERVLDPTCSFQADVRTMLPVVEVRHGAQQGGGSTAAGGQVAGGGRAGAPVIGYQQPGSASGGVSAGNCADLNGGSS